jgi:hypothetical protein
MGTFVSAVIESAGKPRYCSHCAVAVGTAAPCSARISPTQHATSARVLLICGAAVVRSKMTRLMPISSPW